LKVTYSGGPNEKLFLLLALVFSGSGLALTVTGVINGASASRIPVPKAGQWVDFGAGSPPVNGNSFNFPTNSSGAAGYFYTKLPAKPGQTLTLNYTITGNNPVWQQHPQPGGTDSNPASLTLFVWRTGDVPIRYLAFRSIPMCGPIVSARPIWRASPLH
jgi:hypothetical protein